MITCIGVGPGDPELMTLKARRILLGCAAIVFPGELQENSTAWQIAEAAVPEIRTIPGYPLALPMTRDPIVLHAAALRAAEQLISLEKHGEVAFITLGDPSIYCTFSMILPILQERGCQIRIIPGVPSFCAAAAALGEPLARTKEELHILPALYTDSMPDYPGTTVLMKTGARMRDAKTALTEKYDVRAAENCGMLGEHLYKSLPEIPDDAGYFTVVIAKNRQNKTGER